MRAPRVRSIRGQVTLVATLGTFAAMVIVVVATAFAMELLLKSTIEESLSAQLDKAQVAAEAGDYERAVSYAGGNLLQVIDADGEVVASSASAEGLGPILDPQDGGKDGKFEVREPELKQEDASGSARSKTKASDDGSTGSDGSAASGAGASASTGTGAGAAAKSSSGSSASTGASGNSKSGKSSKSTGSSGSASGTSSKSGAISKGSGSGSSKSGSSNDKSDGGSASVGNGDKKPSDSGTQKQPTDPGANAGTGDAARSGNGNAQQPKQPDANASAGKNEPGGMVGPVPKGQQDAMRPQSTEPPAPAAHAPAAAGLLGAAQAFADEATASDSASTSAESGQSGQSAAAESGAVAASDGAGDANDGPATATAANVGNSASTNADDTYVDASSVLGDDGPYLVMQRTVNAPGETVTLAAMASLAPALRSALTTALVLAVLLLVVLALVAVAAWHLSGRTLRPVNRMRLQAESINTSDLGQRIEVPEGDRDLSDLAHTFNELLGRIEASVDEQKRFISDASHELKSPVAATGIMIETLRKRPDGVDLGKLTADLGAENKRMAQIVGDMLLLARQDENRMRVEKTPVDLFDLLYEEAAGLKTRSDIAVDTSGLQPVILQVDAELLSHAVRNLADNAARYAKSTVKLSCSQEDGNVHIVVSDDGPGIPPEDRVRVFDRFVRLEDSRSRKKGSTGLGLAVVRGIVERHGGEVRFEDPELGGATARIVLPAE